VNFPSFFSLSPIVSSLNLIFFFLPLGARSSRLPSPFFSSKRKSVLAVSPSPPSSSAEPCFPFWLSGSSQRFLIRFARFFFFPSPLSLQSEVREGSPFFSLLNWESPRQLLFLSPLCTAEKDLPCNWERKSTHQTASFLSPPPPLEVARFLCSGLGMKAKSFPLCDSCFLFHLRDVRFFPGTFCTDSFPFFFPS